MTVKHAIQVLSAAALGIAVAMTTLSAVATEKDNDQAVREALKHRAGSFCRQVLPLWFSSRKGVRDPRLRAIIVDCYLGTARLTSLGVGGSVRLEDTALSELPAQMLVKETGMNLDFYRPLAGRRLLDSVDAE